MSTDDNDSLLSKDLEDLLGSDDLQPVKPVKKAPAKKTAAKASAKKEEEPEESLDDIKAQLRAELEAEIRADLLKEVQREAAETEKSRKSPTAPTPEPVVDSPDDYGPDEIPPPRVKEVPSGHVLIHFVDDGFTVGDKVQYRGQELTVDPEKESWVNYSRREQIRNWGREVFRTGHWDGGGFDLSDPALNEQEKERLRALARQS